MSSVAQQLIELGRLLQMVACANCVASTTHRAAPKSLAASLVGGVGQNA